MFVCMYVIDVVKSTVTVYIYILTLLLRCIIPTYEHY